MEGKGKMKCECGKQFEEKKTVIEGFKTYALVCPGCKNVTLTKSHAKNLLKLKKLHDIIDADRNIIKIGNSMGITLPDKLQEYGIKVGKKVKTTAISPNSFVVEL